MVHKVLEIYIEDSEVHPESWDKNWFQTSESIVINMSTLKCLLAMAKEKEEESESIRGEKLHKNAKLEKYWNKLSCDDEFPEGNCCWMERFY